MWPFKSNIPEIESVYEDGDGNIEINHSQGRFTINKNEIKNIKLTSDLFTLVKQNSILKRHSFLIILDFYLNSKILTFGYPNLFTIQLVRAICSVILSSLIFFSSIQFLLEDSILDIRLFVFYILVNLFIGPFLTDKLVNTIFSILSNYSRRNNLKKDLIVFQTITNSFTFRNVLWSNSEFESRFLNSFSRKFFTLNNSSGIDFWAYEFSRHLPPLQNENKNEASNVILYISFYLAILAALVSLFFVVRDNITFDSYLFQSYKIATLAVLIISLPIIIVNGIQIVLIGILLLIGISMLAVFFVAAIYPLQILLGIFLFNVLGLLLTPKLIRNRNFNLEDISTEKKWFDRWVSYFFYFTFFTVIIFLLPIVSLFEIGYDRFKINKKSAVQNIIIALGLLIFSVFLTRYAFQLSSYINEYIFDFKSYKNLKDLYYLDKLGWSLIQFEKAFLWGLTSFFVIVVFSWITPRRAIRFAFREVLIGDQLWQMHNIRVDKFRNGDPIPEVNTAEEWKEALDNKQPAMCYYDNDKLKKLYNYYAISDPRGLAPEGWHIPSEDEWSKLILAYGGERNAGVQMKARTYLNCDLGGSRNMDGSFNAVGETGSWWSATEDDAGNAMYITLMKDGNQVQKAFGEKGNGFYVRLVKD
jgi:uncharacterized protein (TIGR02145 family)